MRTRTLLLALVGGGTAWVLHLFIGYFVVALGCPRGWPAIGATLVVVTALCVAVAVGVGAVAWRGRDRARRLPDDGETLRLLLSVAVSLATLFALMIILGGLTVVTLSPCQAGVGGAAR